MQQAAAEMVKAIDEVINRKHTLGGIFEVYAFGLPLGLGSYVHWDRRLDAQLMWSIGSINAIKGVEVGSGFANAARPGSQVHS